MNPMTELIAFMNAKFYVHIIFKRMYSQLVKLEDKTIVSILILFAYLCNNNKLLIIIAGISNDYRLRLQF